MHKHRQIQKPIINLIAFCCSSIYLYLIHSFNEQIKGLIMSM